MEKRVCIVGAGIAGLSSARHLLAAGQEITVIEATSYVGGTWRYEPRTGTDEHGSPIYTSMYDHLRTNLPKQTMEFPGFPIPADVPTYPSAKRYYKYLEMFADHFDLKKHIKFLHEVTLVTRVGDNWRVKYRSIETGQEFEDVYDYVFICNGHFSKPKWPKIAGENIFKGTIIHSHDYRKPDPYVDRRVLVIGAGPSAMDIGLYLADYSTTLVHSHHSRVQFQTKFPGNYVQKPDVLEFTEHGVRFKDGSYEDIDDVIYCTGFEYNFPFLDETSGLTLKPDSVAPLHCLLVNIHQPTMLLFGLIVRACLVLAIDAQARYGAALVSGQFSLPSHDEMLSEWQTRVDGLLAQRKPLREIHHLATEEDDYYANLTRDSGIARVPPVIARIRLAVQKERTNDLNTYRKYDYTILDEYNFTSVYCRSCEPARATEKSQATIERAV